MLRCPEKAAAPAAALSARRSLAATPLAARPPPAKAAVGRGPAAAPEARMHGLAKFVTAVEEAQMKKDLIPLRIGMTVKVGVTVVEGSKTRVQPYQGLIIAKHNHQLNSTITVRKTFQGVGVERVFPVHSPLITIEEVEQAGVPRVRRAKLYYLRDRVGKAARLKYVFAKKATPAEAAAAAAAAAAEPAALEPVAA